MDHQESPWKQGIVSRFRQVNPVVCLLVACFAFSSWIDMYGVWVELPILVKRLPEGWSLPSYLVIIVECCSVIAFLYVGATKVWPGRRRYREMITCYVIMTVGATACVLIAFLWTKTQVVAGSERSVALLSLCAFLCLVDTISTVTYYPYMDRFKPFYMPYYIAGEEIGGMISGFAGLAQGVGASVRCINTSREVYDEETGLNTTDFYMDVVVPEPRFSVTSFFLFLCFTLCVSIASFTLLNFTSFAKKEMVGKKKSQTPEETRLQDVDDEDNPVNDSNGTLHKKATGAKRSRKSLARLTCLGCTNLLGAFIVWGIEPSIQTYACLPYGTWAYTLAIRISTVLNPFVGLIAFLLPTRSLMVIVSFVGTSTVAFGYHMYLAFHSPTPPLHDHVMGAVIVVTLNVLMTTCFVYARANIVTTMRQEGGRNATLYAGLCIQLGAFCGGIIGFLLVNVFHMFKSIPLCPH